MRATLLTFSRRRGAVTPAAEPELTEDQRRAVARGFDGVAEALVSGRSPVAACAVVGRAMAMDGASLGEALTGLRATYTVLGHAQPSFEAAESLALAWSESTLEFLGEMSCEDPLTGLASSAHLRARLAEIYRQAGQDGHSVRSSYALLVIDTTDPWAGLGGRAPIAPGGVDPFQHALMLAAVAEAIRKVFPGEETLGRVGRDKVVALIRRESDLGIAVAAVREWLIRLDAAPEAKIWIEGLPTGATAAARTLAGLALI